MKEKLIVAKDKSGLVVGKASFNFPETLDEAITLEGSKEAVYELYMDAKTIAVRAKLYKRMTAVEQAKLIKEAAEIAALKLFEDYKTNLNAERTEKPQVQTKKVA